MTIEAAAWLLIGFFCGAVADFGVWMKWLRNAYSRLQRQ